MKKSSLIKSTCLISLIGLQIAPSGWSSRRDRRHAGDEVNTNVILEEIDNEWVSPDFSTPQSTTVPESENINPVEYKLPEPTTEQEESSPETVIEESPEPMEQTPEEDAPNENAVLEDADAENTDAEDAPIEVADTKPQQEESVADSEEAIAEPNTADATETQEVETITETMPSESSEVIEESNAESATASESAEQTYEPYYEEDDFPTRSTRAIKSFWSNVVNSTKRTLRGTRKREYTEETYIEEHSEATPAATDEPSTEIMVEDSATHLASDASEPVTTTPEKIDGEKKIAYPTPVARRTYRLSEEKGFAVEITQEPQTPKEAENYVHTIPHEQVIEAHRPMDESSSEVEQVESKALGIVSDVKAQPKGEFKDIGSYSLENVTTGLLLPIGNNNIINTQDHQIEIYLKKPALLSLDKRTSVRLIKILDIHELMLKDGRIRLKLIEESGLWTIRGRDISLSLTPNSDVVVDMTGSLITRIFVLEGSIHCMEATGKKPIHIEAGQHISIGLNDSITTETKSSTTEFIKEYLSLKGVEGKKHDLIAAAHAFHDEANAQWPVSNKLYSGIICTQCNYAFGKKEEALSHCPECKVSLISKIHPSKQKINSNPWILGLNKIGNKFAY